MNRSIAEPRILLLLRVLDGLEKGKPPDRWKLHKTVFLAEAKLQTDCIGGLDYEFIKDKDGPMAPGIYEDLDSLIRAGFVTRDYDSSLTEDGREFLRSLEDLFEANKDSIDLVDHMVKSTSEMSGRDLRRITHEMTIDLNGEPTRIDRFPPYAPILRPLPKAFFKKKFNISDEWKETIEIWSNRESREALKKTFKRITKSDFVF